MESCNRRRGLSRHGFAAFPANLRGGDCRLSVMSSALKSDYICNAWSSEDAVNLVIFAFACILTIPVAAVCIWRDRPWTSPASIAAQPDLRCRARTGRVMRALSGIVRLPFGEATGCAEPLKARHEHRTHISGVSSERANQGLVGIRGWPCVHTAAADRVRPMGHARTGSDGALPRGCSLEALQAEHEAQRSYPRQCLSPRRNNSFFSTRRGNAVHGIRIDQVLAGEFHAGLPGGTFRSPSSSTLTSLSCVTFDRPLTWGWHAWLRLMTLFRPKACRSANSTLTS